MVHKYLFQRNQTYYFRWRVPASLIPVIGKTEIKRSLKTRHPHEAYARAAKLLRLVHIAKQGNLAGLSSVLTRDESLFEMQSELGMRKRLADPEFSRGLITLRSAGLEVDIDHNGDVEQERETAGRLLHELGDIGCIKDSVVEHKEGSVSEILFSELFRQFIKHKAHHEKLSERIQSEYNRYFKTLIEIMGDKNIVSITKGDLREALTAYMSLPKRNLKEYKGVSVLELLEIEVPDEHRLKSKTVEQAKKLLQGIFAFAEGQDMISESPARGLKLDLSSKVTYARFEDAEVRQLLNATRSEGDQWKQWIYMLAAYTGARRGELVQLRKEDIKEDAKSRRKYLLITDQAGSVKTKSAIRQVPIHRRLIDQGFLEFVDKQTGNKIFGELKSQSVTRWFVGLCDKLGIPKYDDYGNRKVFHSFRHTVISKSRAAGNPTDHVQQVVGHEKTSAGTTDRYTHAYPLASVLGVIDKIAY